MKKIFRNLIMGSLVLVSQWAHASFQLETMTVILDAAEPRKVFSVKNTSNSPILLSTKLADIEGGQALAQDVLISPPIIRIEPQESQQINFVLKNGLKLTDEAILKVSFQGVGAIKENATKMPIRQDVAMLIVPSDMTISQTPWDALKIVQSGSNLTLTNTGRQVIRLGPNITVLPSNASLGLGQFYLRPNESKTLTVSGKIDSVKINPLSRYGFKMQIEPLIKVEH
ncbi:fimbria/pilus chaperone family protein [Providencia manganoxydans]|uniref:fimbria/pilus chaperone family protein n=1 Tax=Providencia manganoxydans TaxID=2923283 RepID=UPI0034E5D222